YSDDGVLLLMDLGSAVLSAETALELLPDDRRAHVHLCSGPIVERAVEAVSLAAAGATVEEILRGTAREDAAGPEETVETALTDPLGLHARPAARVVRTARQFQARTNINGVDAGSINALLALSARHGDRVRISARGGDARKAVDAVAQALAEPVGLPGSGGIAIGPVVKA